MLRVMTALPPHERYQEKLFLGSSHWWAQKICNSLSHHTAVLDIGPGSGVMGRWFKDQGVSHVAGVEVDEETREELKETIGS